MPAWSWDFSPGRTVCGTEVPLPVKKSVIKVLKLLIDFAGLVLKPGCRHGAGTLIPVGLFAGLKSRFLLKAND